MCHDGNTRAHRTLRGRRKDQPLRSVLNPDDLGLVLPLCVVLPGATWQFEGVIEELTTKLK